MIRIVGNSWRRLESQKFLHKGADIVRCGDIHPFPLGPKFPRAESVFLRRCDKNFVYYWMKPFYFPRATKIFLDSHPCEYTTVHRFQKQGTVYVSEPYYRHYLGRWWEKADTHVVPISEEQLNKELSRFRSIDTVNFNGELI